jgi:hypothetical protein
MAQPSWDPQAKHCWAKCPITGKTQDLSLTGFVDDLEKTTIITTGTAKEIIEKTKASNEAMNRHIEPYGYAQNTDKETIIPVLFGPGSQKQLTQILQLDSRTTLVGKYLGVLHHYRQSVWPEVHRLCRAAQIGYFSMGRFWTNKQIPFRNRRVTFLSKVLSAAISGTVALVLPRAATDKIEKVVLKLARKAACGSAHYQYTDDDGVVRHEAMTNEALHEYWGIPKIEEELKIQRLKWWQSIIKFPETSAQILAALFGKCQFEDHPQLDEHGRLTTYATPHLRQFYQDISTISSIEGLRWVWEDMQHSITRLFNTRELSEAFCEFDFSELRAAISAINIPPPEYNMPSGTSTNDVKENFVQDVPVELQFQCQYCWDSFSSFRGLRTHLRFSHGFFILSTKLSEHHVAHTAHHTLPASKQQCNTC